MIWKIYRYINIIISDKYTPELLMNPVGSFATTERNGDDE